MYYFSTRRILKINSRYQISDITDISPEDPKLDNIDIAAKKVILDYLRSLDNLKFHFRMLFIFLFHIIYNFIKKSTKQKKISCHIVQKNQNMLISVISDIRYQTGVV